MVASILVGEAPAVQHMFLLLCQWLGEMCVPVSWEKILEFPTQRPLRKALRLQVALAVNGSHLALATSLAPSEELPVKHTLNTIDNDDAQGAFCFAHALTAPRSSTHVGLWSPP